jgi:3-oxoacyl-[acyl-carrier-protein] synthase II
MRRVVITGIGGITPLGYSFLSSWNAALEGKSGIRRITRFSTDNIPWSVAGEIRGSHSLSLFTQKERKRYDLFVQYALLATKDAVEDADVRLPQDTALFIGSSRGGVYGLEKSLEGLYNDNKRLSAYLMPSTTINMAVSAISQRYHLRGYGIGISTACASGAMAISEAYRFIKEGNGDIAIAGGTEAPICRLCLEGYGRMGVLSKGRDSKASRPFCQGRDGFVLAEGATLLVLEEFERAAKRGARIYAEISSSASITDGTNQTGSTVDTEAETMSEVIRAAGISPSDIDLITSHGTSTVVGDEVEYRAMKKVFGRVLKDIAVVACKSQTGHMLAASGAFEIGVAAMAMHKGIVPSTINIDALEFDLNISERAYEKEIKNTLSNAFGFGGINVSIVLKKVELQQP